MFKLELHWQILIAMVFGALIGIPINANLSNRVTELNEGLPRGVVSAKVSDLDGVIRVEWTTDSQTNSTHLAIVDPTGQTDHSVLTLNDLQKENPTAARLYAMAPSYAQLIGGWCKRIGSLFLRLLQMVSVPLIITSLASGILGLGEATKLKRLFTFTAFYYFATSALAVFTGLLVINIFKPGIGSELRLTSSRAQVEPRNLGETIMQQIESMIPANPFAAIVESSFLSIISFTIIFSVFTLLVGGQALERFHGLAAEGFQVMMRMTTAIIQLAPYGVLLLTTYITATQGTKVIGALGWYMVTVSSGLVLHALVTLPLLTFIFARRNPYKLMKDVMPALLTAFSSASSNATLPLTMNNIERRAGISNRISSFVLPLGSTVNMDGTALYEAVAVLFIGQLATGTTMDLSQQLIVALTALLASVGAAGIPHAGLVMMAIVLQAVNLPLEYQGIILAVDRILDMMRTTVNVWSDCSACAVVDRMVDLGTDSIEASPQMSPAEGTA